MHSSSSDSKTFLHLCARSWPRRRALKLTVLSWSWIVAGWTFAFPPPLLAEWSATAEQRTSFTTDAFQFSTARRLRFNEDPSQPTVVPIDKPEDVIWEPSIKVQRLSINGWGKNEFIVKAHGYLFTNNPAFNHGEYRLQDRQWLSDKTAVLLRYRYVPNLFLGPNFERRTGTRSIQEERITSHAWRVEFERRLTNTTAMALVSRYGLRRFNDIFAERDTHFYAVGSHIRQEVGSWLAVILSYLYERGLADGRSEIQFMDDVSYYLHVVSLETECQVTEHLTVDLAYTYMRKTFTSNLVGDTHLGRMDHTHQGHAELRYWFTSSLMGTLSFQRTQRTSTNALRDFNDSIMSVGVSYRF